jgi:hypothetical protein
MSTLIQFRNQFISNSYITSAMIANTSVTAGSYGGIDSSITIQVDEDGRLTSAGSNTIGTSANTAGSIVRRDNEQRIFAKWGGTGTSANQLAGVPIVFTCERRGTGNTTQLMSFGDSSVASEGPAQPYAGKVIAATLNAQQVNSNTVLYLAKNGTANTTYDLRFSPAINGVAESGTTIRYYTTPLQFAAGDRISVYQSQTPNTATGYTVSFFVVYD